MPRSGFSPSRVAPVGSASRLYFPVNQPPPRGDQGSSPNPAAWQAGTISHSMPRTSMLYCGCNVTGTVSPRNSATSTTRCNCQPVKLDSPT